MAQIELRFFAPFDSDKQRAIAHLCKTVVAKVHYDIDEISAGDVTLIIPQLNASLSESDASYELEISESSDNWPKDSATGEFLAHDTANQALNKRAELISATLRKAYPGDSHNIFEVTGIATGWVQYKPKLSST